MTNLTETEISDSGITKFPRSSENIMKLIPEELIAQRCLVKLGLDPLGLAVRSVREKELWGGDFEDLTDRQKIEKLRTKEREHATTGTPEQRKKIEGLLEETESQLASLRNDEYYQGEKRIVLLDPIEVSNKEARKSLIYYEGITAEQYAFLKKEEGYRHINANERSLDLETIQAVYHAREIAYAICETFDHLRPMKGYLEGHSTTVAIQAALLAQEANLKADRVLIEPHKVALAAFLHDIGKLEPGINNLTKKASTLTPKEFEIIKLHPTIGKVIWNDFAEKGHPLLDKFDEENIQLIGEAQLWHHVRPDGNGYPNHLDPSEMPLIAKILGVVDAMDAISFKRVYDERNQDRNQLAKTILLNGLGKQFDQEMGEIYDEMGLRLIDRRESQEEKPNGVIVLRPKIEEIPYQIDRLAA